MVGLPKDCRTVLGFWGIVATFVGADASVHMAEESVFNYLRVLDFLVSVSNLMISKCCDLGFANVSSLVSNAAVNIPRAICGSMVLNGFLAFAMMI